MHTEPDINIESEQTTQAPIDLTKVPKDQVEQVWFEHVYRGDVPQFTLRAVIMGSLIGGFMSLSNLYVGLKTGWGLGVAITACILSYSIYKTLNTILPKYFPTEMTILENNCMQSTASSAGYSTGGTMVSAISAYLIVTGHHIGWVTLTLWTIFLAALGVFMAIPLKRQMINVEQLRFPSGIAAAETLRGLHDKGGDAIKKSRALGIGGIFGGLVSWFKDGIPKIIPSHIQIPGTIQGIPLAKWTISFDMSAIMVAAGALIGWRMGWSLLLGGFITYCILAPAMVTQGAINATHLGYRAIVSWSTWTGASIMVASGLLTFFMQWKTVLKAFSGIFKLFQGRKTPDTPQAAVEVPDSWFITGVTISGIGCAAILHFAFGTTWWMGLIAIITTFLLSIVACRATGESDITPIGAMGKITQLLFGFIAPSNIVTNLMTASVTAGASGSSADLLTDLKSGYLLGANPRQQFLAQFTGIFAGTLVIVPAFYLIVPKASILGTEQWPAPAAQVWASVAKLLANGIHALHPTARWGLLIGALIGIVIPLLEHFLPEKIRCYIPSAMGLGLAMVIPFFNSLSMFLGAAIATLWAKLHPDTAKTYIIALSSGIIAGESLVGVLVALLKATGTLT